MPLGDDCRNLQWHTGARGGILVTGTLLAVEGADQQFDLARPAQQKEPVPVAADVCTVESTGVKPATTGTIASAPGTSARRRLTVSIGKRALTFGVTWTTPRWAAWVSDGPNASNGRTRSDLRIHTASTTVTPSATPKTLSSVRRQSAIKAARWIRRTTASWRAACASPLLGVRSPVDEVQFAGPVARRGPIVCHHDHRRAVFV